MSTNIIIESIEECLSKPNLHPDARAGLEQRLQYWLDKERPRRRWKRTDKANKASVKSRMEMALKNYQEVLPLIQELRDDGLTYKKIAAEMQKRGLKTLKGTPYSESWIGQLLREVPTQGRDEAQAGDQ